MKILPPAMKWIGLVLVLGSALSCSKNKDSYLVVHTDVDCHVPAVFQLHVTISNGGSSDDKFFPENTPTVEMGFPSDFSFIIPGYRSGLVEISIDALDKGLNVIGQGSANKTLNVGGRTDLDVPALLPVSQTICGNGIVEQGEQCDDGNRVSGDGCSSNCQLETPTSLVDGGVLISADAGKRDGAAAATNPGSSTVPYLQVAVGGTHSCAVRVDSTLWCWGNNEFGQLRLPNTSDKKRLSPGNVGGTAWNRVSCGQSHACAMRTDGSASCWGNNTSGQLGSGGNETSGQIEVAGAAPWQGISAGSYQTCGVQVDGTLWCWGDNTNGQLGIGSLDAQRAPVAIVETGFTHVGTSFLHTCATRNDGSMWCWGMNANNQTGDSNGSYHINPVQLDGTDWIDLTTGFYHTCGLKRDNTLWCWGGNQSGQLGNATIPVQDLSTSATAMQVDGTWQSASAGQSHTCAIALDGSLWCWGSNSAGQLGTGSALGNGIPVVVRSSVATWSMVASGNSHTCAVASDGSLWCWGDNTDGQLGLGSTAAHLVPTRVGP